MQTLIKTEQTTEKTRNFGKLIIIFSTSHNQSLNVLHCFILELIGFIFYIYAIFICSFEDCDKIRANNAKNTKLSKTHLDYLNNLQSFSVGWFFLEYLALIVCSTLMRVLKMVPVQGLPLYSKIFSKCLKLMESKVFIMHKISAIQDFCSGFFLRFKSTQNCQKKSLSK